MRPILVSLLLSIAVAACEQQQQPPAEEPAQAQGIKGVHRDRAGQPAPSTSFRDPDGQEMNIGELKGTPVLVNLWATWCAPCVKELPTLDRLAAANTKLRVLTVSQDNAPQGSVEAFLERLKVSKLQAHHDPEMALSGSLEVEVLPTTVLYGRDGREVWRYVGDLDWTGPEAAKLLAEAR